eukprot:jgi/Mesvir1/13103/Mv06082-RA.1
MSGTENVGQRQTVERATVSTQSDDLTPRLLGGEADPLLDNAIARATGAGARKRSVSLYWLEKSNVGLDYAQLLGFMWIISRVWPWPEGLRLYLKWTAIAVGDIHAYFDAPKFQGGIDDWFDMRGFSISAGRGPGWRYYSYLTFFMGLSAGSIGFFLLAHGLRKRLRQLLRLGFGISRGMYLPIAITAARLCSCRVLGHRLTTDYPRYYEKRGITAVDLVLLDPNESCDAIPHVRTLAVLSVCLAFLVFLPAYVTLTIMRRLVHADPVAHERYLRCRELEHLAGFSSTWRAEGFYLFSSFRRSYAYQEPLLLLHKAAVALLLLMPDKHDWGLAQLVVFIALVAAMPLLRPWPYRCTSSNVMYQILHWLLVMQAWPGLLLHSGMHSFFLLPNVMWTTMLILNLGALTIIAIVAAVPYRQRLRTGKGVWPVHHGVLERMRRDWLGGRVLSALIESRRFFLAMIRRPALLVPRDEVEAAMVRLQEVLDDARVEGHILVDALDDAMDDLVTLECKAKDSVIPNRRLRALMAQLRVKMDARERALALVDPRKSRALLKLIAIRVLTAGRVFPFRPAEAAAAQQAEDEGMNERMEWEGLAMGQYGGEGIGELEPRIGGYDRRGGGIGGGPGDIEVGHSLGEGSSLAEFEMGRYRGAGRGEGDGDGSKHAMPSSGAIGDADVPLLLGTENSMSTAVSSRGHHQHNGVPQRSSVNGTAAKNGNGGRTQSNGGDNGAAAASAAAAGMNAGSRLPGRQDSRGRASGASGPSQQLAREGTLSLPFPSGHLDSGGHVIDIPGSGAYPDAAGNQPLDVYGGHSMSSTNGEYIEGKDRGGLTGAGQSATQAPSGVLSQGFEGDGAAGTHREGAPGADASGGGEPGHLAAQHWLSSTDPLEFSFGRSLRVRPAATTAGGDPGSADKHVGKSRFVKGPA